MTEERTARWSRFLIFTILVTLPLERIPSFEVTSPVAFTVRVSQLAGLALILINVPMLWRAKRQLIKAPWLWMVLFGMVGLVTAPMAANDMRAVSVLAFTAFAAFLAWVIANRMEVHKMALYTKLLVGTAVATCAFGLYQFFGDLMGLAPQLTGLREQYTSGVFGFPRVQATGLEPLYFDNFLLIPIGLVVAGMPFWRRRLWWWLALTFMMLIIFLNVSRGAIVALILLVLIGIVVAFRRGGFKPAALILSAIIVAAAGATGLISAGSAVVKNKTVKSEAAVTNFAKQVTNVSSGESTEFRALSRQRAIEIWREHPLFGVGMGNFGRAAHDIDPNNFADDKAIVNNEPLEILVETGLVGLGLIVGFIVSIVVMFIKAVKRAGASPTIQMSLTGLGMALLATGAQYQTFSTLYITHVWVALGLLVGVMMVALRTPKHAHRS